MVLALVPGAVLGDGWGHHGWDGGWLWLWGSLMMLFWAAVIGLAVYWVVRSLRSPREASGVDRAREILAQRYARGELTTDEYRERLDALE